MKRVMVRMLGEGDDGGDVQWFVCDFVSVWIDHKK
jgi:hypothetical protein